MTQKIFPKGNHVLLASETGSTREFPRLKRCVPGFYATLIEWIGACLRST